LVELVVAPILNPPVGLIPDVVLPETGVDCPNVNPDKPDDEDTGLLVVLEPNEKPELGVLDVGLFPD